MSSSSEEDFIKYGTPFEPLEEDEIPAKKPCLVEDQVATDKQGRRLFHGAFTGGFSAGFFNTVGTLEGWKPSSFKSSKSEKQKVIIQKPEDFMDEEDFSEFGIAPVILKARQDYIQEKHSLHLQESQLGKYVLKGLLRPTRETLGVKLLKKMGWKPGQGVGPRITSNEKKIHLTMREKVYGFSMPFDEPTEEQEESNLNVALDWHQIKLAPSDYEPFLCGQTDNIFGIGYKGLDKRSILSSSTSFSGVNNSCTKKSSQAFGVGALEEEDEDIFARDDMSHYDFSLENETQQEPTVKISINYTEVLDGFVPQLKKTVKKNYSLPTLPKNIDSYIQFTQPLKKLSSDSSTRNKTRWNEDCNYKVQTMPNQEMKLPVIQNFVNEENRHINEEKKTEFENQQAVIEKLISNVKINTSKFKPFLNDSEKQARYEKYLKLIEIEKPDFLKNIQPLNMTEWDKEKEKMEFEKAAALFRPLNAMEDRFLTASQPDDVSDPLAVVEKFQHGNDDRAKAATLNMFGSLTRIIENWTPCQLLCKRFNIPEPKKTNIQDSEKKTKKYSLFDLSALNQNENFSSKNAATQSVVKVVDETQQEFNLEKETPNTISKEEPIETFKKKTDLFKEIFLTSDSEDVEDEGKISDVVDIQSEKSDAKEISYEEHIINNKKNTSLPSGIFENIDFDSLNAREKIKLQSEPADPKNLGEDNNLFYGPKLPEKVAVKPKFFNPANTVDEENWVEKKIRNKKKKKKDKKKNKKSCHPTKHKHKKKIK